MRTIRTTVPALALVLMSGTTLHAQSQTQPDSRSGQYREHTWQNGQPTTPDRASEADLMTHQEIQLVPSDWIIGQRIVDAAGHRLGEIKDLILDAKDGHVVYALVNRLGTGGNPPGQVAVPWLAFDWNNQDRTLSLPMSSERLNQAEAFETGRWERLDDPTWADRTYGYYNVERNAYERGWSRYPDPARDIARNPDDPQPTSTPPGKHDPGDDIVRNPGDPDPTSTPSDKKDAGDDLARNPDDPLPAARPPANPSDTDRDRYSRPDTDRDHTDRDTDRDHDADDHDDADRDDGAIVQDHKVDQGAYVTGEPDRQNRDDMASSRQYILASKVKGQTLRGSEDKVIGDVDELVFDASSGRMGFIVAQFGGFLGIGDSKVAVPWDYFKVNDEGHLYTNDIRADEVRTAPRLEQKDWAELRDPNYGPRVYQHYGRDPGWFQSGFYESRPGTTGQPDMNTPDTDSSTPMDPDRDR